MQWLWQVKRSSVQGSRKLKSSSEVDLYKPHFVKHLVEDLKGYRFDEAEVESILVCY